MTVDQTRKGAPRSKGSCLAVLRSPAPTRSESGHRRQDPGSSLSPGKTRTKLAAAGRPPSPEFSRCHRRMGWCAHCHPLRRPRTSSTPPEVSRGCSFQPFVLTSLCAESNHLILPTACAAAFTDVCRHPCPSPSLSWSSASGQPRVTAAAGTPRARRVSWSRRESRGREPCMMRCNGRDVQVLPSLARREKVIGEAVSYSDNLVRRRLLEWLLHRAHAI